VINLDVRFKKGGNWKAEYLLLCGREDVLDDVIRMKIAEKDGKTFVRVGSLVYGIHYFDKFPNVEGLYQVENKLKKELDRRVEELLFIQDSLNILNEIKQEIKE